MAHHENEVAAVGAVGTVLAAFLSAWALLRGREKSSPAETQEQINDGFKILMEKLEARVMELERRERAYKQYTVVLVRLLQERGIEAPPFDPDIEFLMLPPNVNGGVPHAD